jgi:hypothetical protein
MPEHIALAPDFNSPAIDGATLAESTRFQSEAAVTNPQAERPDTQPVAPENTTSSPATAAGSAHESGSSAPVAAYGVQLAWIPNLQCEVRYDTSASPRTMTVRAEGMAKAPSPAVAFKIDAADVAKLSRITNLKSKGAPDLVIEVGAADLTCIATTLKNDFTVGCTLPLRDTVVDRSFAFRIDSDLLARIGDRFDGPMTFTFDSKDDTLRWREDKREGSFSKAVMSAEPRDIGGMTQLSTLATLPVATLAAAVRYSAMFASQALRERNRHDGLRIGGGSATSGCLSAGAKYTSTAIPDDIDIVLPLHNAGNLNTVLAKLSGPADIAATDTTVYLKTQGTLISWAKGGDWPASLDRAFELPAKTSVTFLTEDLLSAVIALSIAMREVEIRIERGENDLGRLVLAGQSILGTGSSAISPWSQVSELPEGIWTFSLDVANLLNVLTAVKTDQVVLEVLDRGIYLRSRAQGYETTALLLGKQLS